MSPHTIASYRDTFRLLLQFTQRHLKIPPSDLELRHIDSSLVGAFLDDLERRRSIGARTRNLRLTAMRSFFRFVALEEPSYSAQTQRILLIPSKLHDKRVVHFLIREEIEALLAVPDIMTWVGRRDRALLLLAVQTGLRLSEIVQLNKDAVILGRGAHVRCTGKGRICCTTHTRTNVLRTHMCSCTRGHSQRWGFEKKMCHIYFRFARAQMALRKPISPGSLRQRFATSISSPRSVRASAFAFISRSTSA